MDLHASHNIYGDNGQVIATITKKKELQPTNVYQPTELDARKAAVDFRITSHCGSKAEIVWRDGRVEYVTRRRMEKLEALHTWACDF